MEIKIPPNYGPRYNKMFEAVFTSVAEETDVPLLPFFIESIAVHPELMQSDGIHPTIEAQPQIVEIMEQKLQKMIEG